MVPKPRRATPRAGILCPLCVGKIFYGDVLISCGFLFLEEAICDVPVGRTASVYPGSLFPREIMVCVAGNGIEEVLYNVPF